MDFDGGKGISVDSEGNSYVIGIFSGTAIIGDSTFISEGFQDVFIAKYNMDGIFQWAIQDGRDGPDVESGIAVDGLQNVYATGSFYSDMVNIGDTILTKSGENDIFIAKYSPAAAPIPTLGQWSVFALSLLLLIFGVVTLKPTYQIGRDFSLFLLDGTQ